MSRNSSTLLRLELILKPLIVLKKIATFDLSTKRPYKYLIFFLFSWKLFLVIMEIYLFHALLPNMERLHSRVMEKYTSFIVHCLNISTHVVSLFSNSSSYLKYCDKIFWKYKITTRKAFFLKLRWCMLIEFLAEESVLLCRLIMIFKAPQMTVVMYMQTLCFVHSEILLSVNISEFSFSLITLALSADIFDKKFQNTSMAQSITCYIGFIKEVRICCKMILGNFSNIVVFTLFQYFFMVTYTILALKIDTEGELQPEDFKYYWIGLSIFRVLKIISACCFLTVVNDQMLDYLKISSPKMCTRDKKEVHWFFLGLLHEPHLMEIKSSLVLNGALLFSALSSITTYAVILLQLDEDQNY
ncbi:uncharacterized protein LOC123315549 [Coccinella septempunctata]|uniref:uncharacterized protein LOC123315549 n=1 Tax=Coccinella septempunctata TaxID=41139 RepID=UPI001D069896|nr:uncharacterized protein LOC123315549 [Coccinella septempunctata]